MAVSGVSLKRHLSLRSGDIDRRMSLGVAVPTSRTELIIQKSKEALARKNQFEKEQEAQRAAGMDQRASTLHQENGQVTTTGWQELHSVSELLSHLKTMYVNVVEGEGSPMIGAKSVFGSARQYFKNQDVETPLTLACNLLRENLCLSSFKVKEKYKGKSEASALECKFREFLLQVCLQFEMNSEAGADDISEDVASELASMLSSVAIVKGANFLSTYLNDLLQSYLDSSAKLLLRIHENLGRSAPPQLQHLLSPDQEDEDHSSLPPPSTQQMPSVSSAASNNSYSNENIQQKKRSLYRYPTFNPVPMKQILLEPKNQKNVTRRSARIATSSILSATQVADQLETKRVKRTLFGVSDQTDNLRRRMSLPLDSSLSHRFSSSLEKPVLRSPEGSRTSVIKAHHVLKTRKVSETPVHKQGCNSVVRQMERLRRQANIESEGVEVIEESPMKPLPDRNDTLMTGSVKSGGQERIKRHMTFYPQTAAAQSRNVNRYKRLEERMTHQVTSPTSPEKPLVQTTSKTSMTSPRRITARVLFGLSPSPFKSVHRGHCSKDGNGTPEFTLRLSRSVTSCTVTTNSGNDPTSKKTPELCGVTILESPTKSSAVDHGLMSFTSPAKNTRLQALLESRLQAKEQTTLPNILNSSFLSPAKGASQELDKDGFLSPAKNTRLQLRLDRLASSQSTVDFSNFMSPTKTAVACTQLDFNSPAKNTRFQARQGSSQKSKGTSTLQIVDDFAALSSPPRTESSLFNTTPTSKQKTVQKNFYNTATESPAFGRSSPTFGSCRQRTTTDSSPVFSSGKRSASNFAEISLALKNSSPKISGSRSNCGVKQTEGKSRVESPVRRKAKKRLLMSPDSGNTRKRLLLSPK